MRKLAFASDLATPAETVWAAVSTMNGVNDELMPLMCMTYPPELSNLESAAFAPNKVLFRSWLMLFGCVPVDRHSLRLERLYPGEGFDERSSSWTQRVWIHRRRVLVIDAGCRVSDELEFQPRVSILALVLHGFVRMLFRHRHRRLRAKFGTAST
ncbi:MAG: hypothetical protein ACT4PZ_16440 [Panacagrimonas sp.]